MIFFSEKIIEQKHNRTENIIEQKYNVSENSLFNRKRIMS